jgi:DNA-binding GntR family transcriptional regulator
MRLTRGPTPHYHQFKEDLLKQFESDEFKLNDWFPTGEYWHQTYGANMDTIGSVIEILVEESWLYRGQGGGILVSRLSLSPVFFHLAGLATDTRQHESASNTGLFDWSEFPACRQIPVKEKVAKMQEVKRLWAICWP